MQFKLHYKHISAPQELLLQCAPAVQSSACHSPLQPLAQPLHVRSTPALSVLLHSRVQPAAHTGMAGRTRTWQWQRRRVVPPCAAAAFRSVT